MRDHNLSRSFLVLTLSVVATATSAMCQGGYNERGPLGVFAQGLSLKDTRNNRPAAIARKPAGDRLPLSFGTVPFTDEPVYSADLLIPGGVLDIDAMSTGNDILPIVYREVDTGEGTVETYVIEPRQGLFGWASIAFGYGALDSSSGVINDRQQVVGSVTADIFSYWFADSVGLPQDLVGKVMFEAGREHMRLPAEMDVMALDTYMPVIKDSGGLPGAWIQRTDNWYFSITPESANDIRTAWCACQQYFTFTEADKVTAATVFRVEWDGVAWSRIAPEFLPAQTNIPAEANIDALAYDEATDRFVFSLQYGPFAEGHSQFQVGSTTRPPLDLYGPNPDRPGEHATIEELLGTVGDVTMLCGLDPQAHAVPPDGALSPWMGMATSGPLSPLRRLTASVERFLAPNGEHSLMVMASALPPVPGTLTWSLRVGGVEITLPFAHLGDSWSDIRELPLRTVVTGHLPMELQATFESAAGSLIVDSWVIEMHL
jgi:hypothetical protein